MSASLVFLVPGCFGCTSVCAVSDFADVQRTQGAALRRRGPKARTLCCNTRPTVSIPRRAAEMLRAVRRRGAAAARVAAPTRPATAVATQRRLDTDLGFEATWDAVAAAIAGKG